MTSSSMTDTGHLLLGKYSN